MKPVSIARVAILTVLIFTVQQAVISQDLSSDDESAAQEDLHTGKLISTYREFFKREQYGNAQDSWWILFNDFPGISERLYVDGVTMYRQFIEETPEGQARNSKVDTLMLIYDQRMANFGGEGNIQGRKGSDLLRYRSADPQQVQAAYSMLKRSVEIEGTASREAVLLNYLSAGLLLEGAAMLDRSEVLKDYFQVVGLLDRQEGSNSRREKTRASMDEMMLKEGILTCEGLNLYFEPQFEQNSGDRDLIEKVIRTYALAECRESTLYIAATEKMYEIDPGPESAHQLALLFISRNNLDKASWYLQMAVLGENVDNKTRADWFYELSIVSLAKGDHCEAIDFAREALAYQNEHGKACMALGDAFIACRKRLGDDFHQQSAYWAAADMYQLAAEVDPALAEESRQKLAMCTAQFPSTEDIFFQDLLVGNSYLVGGCIQEQTTVRSRD